MAKEAWTAGVDIGGTKINLLALNRSGTVGKTMKIPTHVDQGVSVIAQEIAQALKALIAEIGLPPAAIGIGVAGQVDEETQVITFAPNLKWQHVALSNELYQLLHIPVVTTNDVRAATWGEWLHGAGKDCQDLLCVFIGTGIGGGIVSNGKMLTGFNNTAGEIGHITVSLDGPVCSCGNWGCMEAYAGGWALAQRAIDALGASEEGGEILLKLAGGFRAQVQGVHVMQAACSGDPLACRVVDRAIAALGAGVAGLINTVGPKRIIFGGGVIEGNPWLIDRLSVEIGQRALKAAHAGVTVAQAKLHNDAGAIGAAALASRRRKRLCPI